MNPDTLCRERAEPVPAGSGARVEGWSVDGAAFVELRGAIQADVRDGRPGAETRRALRAFGADLRERGLDARHLVIALKSLHASVLDGRAGVRDHTGAIEFRDRLVTAGIEEFYGSATRRRTRSAPPQHRAD